jgi:hypothetical protein
MQNYFGLSGADLVIEIAGAYATSHLAAGHG